MNKKKSLIAGIIMGTLVFVIFGMISFNNQAANNPAPSNKHEFVVAKEAIKKDSVILETNVEIKDFPMDIEGAYKATGELIGRIADVDIEAGTPIMKTWIQEIEIKKKQKDPDEPRVGFRAVPIMVKKSTIPPYITTSGIFDLFSKEDSMVIENLRILNIIEPESDKSSKMFILEIKNHDVKSFIEHQVANDGFYFIQKNPSDYGEYRYSDQYTRKLASAKTGSYISQGPDTLGSIPDIVDYGGYSGGGENEVEVIIGNTKTKLEFDSAE